MADGVDSQAVLFVYGLPVKRAERAQAFRENGPEGPLSVGKSSKDKPNKAGKDRQKMMTSRPKTSTQDEETRHDNNLMKIPSATDQRRSMPERKQPQTKVKHVF